MQTVPKSPEKGQRPGGSPLRGGGVRRALSAPLSPRSTRPESAAAAGGVSRLTDCMQRLRAASSAVSAATTVEAPRAHAAGVPLPRRAVPALTRRAELSSLAASLATPAASAPPPAPSASPLSAVQSEKALLAFALASAKEETSKAARRAAAAEAAAAAAEAGRAAASDSLAVMATHHGRLVAALEAERTERRRAQEAHEAERAALLARAHGAEEALRLARAPPPPPPPPPSPPRSPPRASPPLAQAMPPATPWGVRRLREAEARKEAGNALFRDGAFEAAAAEYGAGIAAAPGASAAGGGGGARATTLRAVLHSNRAAALQALGRALDAALDCSVALSLDPGYRRARERRADALAALGDAAGALADLRALAAAADGATDAEAAALRAKVGEAEARAAAAGEGAGADHYAVLGLPPACTAAEARAAYRALALRHHPDKAAAEGGPALRAAHEHLFVLLNAAHACLCDPAARRRYDSLRSQAAQRA